MDVKEVDSDTTLVSDKRIKEELELRSKLSA